MDIRLPLFIDENTPLPEGTQASLSNGVAGKSLLMVYRFALADDAGPAKPLPGTPKIHMDAMAFGMGCCCLQITFQAWNVDEARRVYDALVPVAPIMVS